MTRLLVACAALAFMLGCQCDPPLPGDGDGGAGGSAVGGGGSTGTGGGSPTAGGTGTGGGATGGGNTLSDGGVCTPAGQPCGAGSSCCSNGTCVAGLCRAPMFCSQNGVACNASTDCCSARCSGGVCSAQQCVATGQACTSAGECCSGLCNGTCQTVPGGTCKVVGDACTGNAECCSTLCQGGVCRRAFSCQANGDVCRSNAECCGQRCAVNGDGGVGRCLFITGGGAGSCVQEGNPCNDGSTCCSRICFDPGTGAKVCLAAGGCRLTGTWCNNDNECCGGGVNPNGSVVCDNGRCDNGRSCNGVGNICGRANLPDGGSVMINASMNCCGGDDACKLDRSGIPRCFGGPPGNTCPSGYTGQAPCCIGTGDVCQFRDQCCNGQLCLPGDGGVLRCQGLSCTQAGGACATDANCCAGNSCLLNVCRPPVTMMDAGVPADGGMGGLDAGSLCRANGATCQFSIDCCSQVCTNATCGPALICQPVGGACRASADCCSGTTCAIPAGQQTGTCSASTCVAQGQTCTAGGQSCCAGLGCYDSNFFPCSGSGSCSCRFGIQ